MTKQMTSSYRAIMAMGHKKTVTKAQQSSIMPQANFSQKITFDMLYTNRFLIRICSRTLFISSECNTI